MPDPAPLRRPGASQTQGGVVATVYHQADQPHLESKHQIPIPQQKIPSVNSI